MAKALIFVLMGMTLAAGAQDLPANVIFRQGLTPVSLEMALGEVKPGSIVVLGEQHGTTLLPLQQLQVMEILRNNGLKVSVGLEFLTYPNQASVDAWHAGNLAENDFLKQVGWGAGFPFTSYREQALFPLTSEGAMTIALNAPKALTSRIAQVGLDGLTAAEMAQMPPHFQLGNAAYLARFAAVMGTHLPTPEALNRYFAAQSTWDDTMAWKATDYIQHHPDQVLVIIVGEFHVQYGGGLPDRLKARGAAQVTTFSQVNLYGLSDIEQHQAVEPTVQDGNRADFLWTSRFAQ